MNTAEMPPLSQPAHDQKTPWQSKTLCVALVTTVAPFLAQAFPAVGEWLRDNVELTCSAIGVVFGLLRIATKGRISLGA